MLVLLKLVVKSQTFFCLSVALLMVAARLFFFDYEEYFQLKNIPSDDMYQGAAFFTTSMHSMRISGDIAWWNPIDHNNGYAQYYQSFFAPLAPTTGHIVFIVWAQIIYLLNRLNISIPEYYQYLIVNYAILPFLYFTALAYFASLLFRRRATIFFVMTVCTFSYAGWVNSTWFYFQEPFTMLLVVGAAIGYIKCPTPQRLGWLLLAGLIQLVSFNYWTVFNFWFILILLGVYIWLHPHQWRRVWLRTRATVHAHRLVSILLGVLIVITILVWIATLGSIFQQQSGNYERTLLKLYEESYKIESVEIDYPDNYSWQLFNPHVSLFSTYLGAFLIPLLALLPVYRWRRLEKWLFACAVGALMISFAPPYMLRIWELVPFMDRIRHFFLFYPLYWKFSLVLLAGASLDTLLSGRLSLQEKRRATWLMVAVMSGSGLVVLGFDDLLQPMSATDRAHIGVVVLITSLVLYRLLIDARPQNRQVMVTILLILTFTDLSRHFWAFRQLEGLTEVAWQEKYKNPKAPLPDNVTQALREPWSALDPATPVNAYRNMPMRNDFWPNNFYVWHRFLFDSIDAKLNKTVLEAPRLTFHTEFAQIPSTGQIQEPVPNDILWLHHPTEGSTFSSLEIGSNWHDLESGLQSGEVYRWVENNAEITITTDPASLTDQLRLEVEPGPGVENQPFELELRTSQDEIIGRVLVTSRQWIEFELPPTETAVYHLHIEGGGKLTANGDTRILNFRVMHIGLDSRPRYNFLSDGHAQPIDYQWGYFDYNTLAFNVDTSQSGWLSLAQIYDPLWVITVDGEVAKGEQANFVRTAIPIEAGQHEIRLEYRPLTRKLYWPASFLLEFTVVVIFTGLVLSHKPRKFRVPLVIPQSGSSHESRE